MEFSSKIAKLLLEKQKPVNRYIFPFKYLGHQQNDGLIYYSFCKRVFFVTVAACLGAVVLSSQRAPLPSDLFFDFVDTAPIFIWVPVFGLLLPIYLAFFVATIPKQYNPFWWNPNMREATPWRALRASVGLLAASLLLVFVPQGLPLVITETYHALPAGYFTLLAVIILWTWAFPVFCTCLFISLNGIGYSVHRIFHSE